MIWKHGLGENYINIGLFEKYFIKKMHEKNILKKQEEKIKKDKLLHQMLTMFDKGNNNIVK